MTLKNKHPLPSKIEPTVNVSEICDADKGRSRAGSHALPPMASRAQLAVQASQVVAGPSGTPK
jgi:hypothetical protein